MKPRRRGTTTAAGVLAIAVSLVMGAYGTLAVLAGLVAREAATGSDGLVQAMGEALAGFLLVGGALVLGATVWGTVIGAAVLRRRRWARIAGIVTFSGLGALAALFVIVALGDPGDDFELGGVLVAVADFGVVGLLGAGSTGRDLRAHQGRRRA